MNIFDFSKSADDLITLDSFDEGLVMRSDRCA